MHFLLPIVLIVLFDQLTKYLVRDGLALGQSFPIIDGIFHLTHVENPGAAFGILANHRLFFLLITVVIIGAMVYLYWNLRRKQSLAAFSLGLVVGGAIGNLIDRMVQGTVTDFFDFRIWPVFNIADIAVCVGLALLCYLLLFRGDDL